LEDEVVFKDDPDFTEIDNQHNNDLIQFQAFEKEKHSQINTASDTIYISITDLTIFGVDSENKKFSELLNPISVEQDVTPMLKI
jgi:hypothetical protein